MRDICTPLGRHPVVSPAMLTPAAGFAGGAPSRMAAGFSFTQEKSPPGTSRRASVGHLPICVTASQSEYLMTKPITPQDPADPALTSVQDAALLDASVRSIQLWCNSGATGATGCAGVEMMTPLPLNVARCPGRGLTDLLTRRPYTDLYCSDCPRHIQHKADLAQWVSDCRPRILGGDPALPGARMTPPPREQWINGACPVRAEDGAPA